jgi:eukaryotic-like serine/threonine-protein kinase
MSLVRLADRYRVGDVIGRGGMADVHAAVDERLERDVAVKIMRPGSVAADDLEARFDDEARIAASLQHPNVVAVYDTGATDDGRPYIIMERLPGETLADRMRNGPLPDPAVRAIAEDVLAALGAAHAAGIVHRDIKPGNILLTDDGRAKIADFGIARESDTLLVDPTTTNALTGTPAYLAPERIEGGAATARSDIWALGVVLYEALAGNKPFDGPTPLAVAMAVRDGEAPRLNGGDPALVTVIDRAMSRDPNLRYATAAEMASAINVDATQRIDDSTVVLAAPAPAAAAAVPPWWRRLPSRTLSIAGATAAAIALLIGIGLVAGRSDDGGPSVPAKPVGAQATTLPITTVTSTPPTVQPVQAPVATVRRRAGKGRKGGRD